MFTHTKKMPFIVAMRIAPSKKPMLTELVDCCLKEYLQYQGARERSEGKYLSNVEKA